MRKKQDIIPIFGILFIISLLFVVLGKSDLVNSIRLGIESLIVPVEKTIFGMFENTGNITDGKFAKLSEENRLLQKRLLDQKLLEKENKALKDQFQGKENPQSKKLLPAHVIGMPRFLPGISRPEYYILDKGQADGVKVGYTVVVNNNLIGKIDEISPRLARVKLLTGKDFSFTATSPETNADGVIKGQGNTEMIFDNVLLSDTLKTNAVVITKGDVTKEGIGLLPHLLVGKIVSVEKKASNLFQSAKIKSFLDFTKITLVFIVTGY